MIINKILTTNIENIDDLQQKVDNLVTEVQETDASRVMDFLIDKVLPPAINVVLALLVFFIGTKLIKLARRLLKKSLERSNAETGLIQFLDSLAKIGLYVILLCVIFGGFGKNAASLAAILASGGVAIGLALQGSLSNFAGGVLILLLKPFVVGDYIIEDTNKNEGTVKEIQIFYTKLVTVDNKVIVIPNGVLSNSSLTNATDQSKRRLDLFIGIGYDADLKKAKQIMTDVLKNESAILNEPAFQVFVDDLMESSVKLGFRAWVNTDDFMTAKWRVLEDLKLAFDKNGITIPYPQMEVTIKQET